MPNKEHYFLTATEFYNTDRGEFFGKPIPNVGGFYDESFVTFELVDSKISSIRSYILFCARDLANVKEPSL
jgi:hypothetical protein